MRVAPWWLLGLVLACRRAPEPERVAPGGHAVQGAHAAQAGHAVQGGHAEPGAHSAQGAHAAQAEHAVGGHAVPGAHSAQGAHAAQAEHAVQGGHAEPGVHSAQGAHAAQAGHAVGGHAVPGARRSAAGDANAAWMEAELASARRAPDPRQTPSPSRTPDARQLPVISSRDGGVESSQALRLRERAAADLPVRLRADGQLTMDFPSDARVALWGPAQLLIAPGGAQALLLGEGACCVEMAPGAPSPRREFELTTPAARLRIVRGARLCAAVAAGGALRIAVVSGAVSVVRGSAGEQGIMAEPWQLLPGDAVRLDVAGQVQRHAPAPRTLDEARAWLRRNGLRTARQERGQASPASRLAQALADSVQLLESAQLRTQQLSAVHHALVRADNGQAMSIQRELAGQAAHAARVREQVDTLRLRHRAALLANKD